MDGGMATEALIAHGVMSSFCDGLPCLDSGFQAF
jgi:hypothetical protein